jgi:hypothetical protein
LSSCAAFTVSFAIATATRENEEILFPSEIDSSSSWKSAF